MSEPALRRRRRSPQETRQLIIEAAVAILHEGSYRDLGVEAVMARTGLTRTLFYRHFESVPALMLTLIAEMGGDLVKVAEAWAGGERVGPEEARERLRTFVDFQIGNAALVRAVVDAAHRDPEVQLAYDGMVEIFVTITERAIRARIAPANSAVDAAELARALVRMLNGYLGDPRRSKDPDVVLETVWTIWTRTLFGAS